MTDWRYWITFEGDVSAPDEESARYIALGVVYNDIHDQAIRLTPTVELEEIGND